MSYHELHAQDIARIYDAFDAHACYDVRHGVLPYAIGACGGAEALPSVQGQQKRRPDAGAGLYGCEPVPAGRPGRCAATSSFR